MTEINNNEEKNMDFKIIYESILDIVAKGKVSGLTKGDYKQLYSLKKQMDDVLSDNLQVHNHMSSAFYDFYNRVTEIINYIHSTGAFKRYESQIIDEDILDNEVRNYINEHAKLLPLVIANDACNSITFFFDDSYRLRSHFKDDSESLMYVYDIKNRLYYDHGHCNFTPISYLEKVEGISQKEACLLLAKLYAIDIKIDGEVDEKLYEKYRNAILSEEYYDLMSGTEARFLESDTYDIYGIDIPSYYEDAEKNIERIRLNMKDKNYCPGRASSRLRLPQEL